MKELSTSDKKKIQKNNRFLKMYGDSIQGNIARGQRKEHTAFLFLRWETGNNAKATDNVKAYLKELANDDSNRFSITSASRIESNKSRYGRNKSPNFFLGIYFTAKGLEWLGKSNSKWEEIYNQLKKNNDFNQEINWENNFKVQPNMMIMLAHSSKELVKTQAKKLKNIFVKKFKAKNNSFIEYGNVYRNRFGQSVEHFGFADGISQPWFFEDQVKSIPNEESWNPIRPLKEHFFIKEEETSEKIGEDCYGSFLVYRKFEQNVISFHEEISNSSTVKLINSKIIKALRKEDNFQSKNFKNHKYFDQLNEIIKNSDENREALEKKIDNLNKVTLLGAKKKEEAARIGRFSEGSPLAKYDLKDMVHSKAQLLNKDRIRDIYLFKFKNKCPHTAHIRKMNNREELDNKMIIRRGMTYGNRNLKANGEFDLKNLPEADVGLHFLSFQKELGVFLDMVRYSQENGNQDAILGENSNLIMLRGGANFYVPSIDFFQQLI